MSVPSAERTVTVDLGDRSYPILVGGDLLGQSGAFIATHAPTRKAAIITDANVADAHLGSLKKSLSENGIECAPIVLSAGEATKRFGELERVLEDLLAAGIERNDLIVAFGGGVIGDLAGCAAGLLRRGVRFVQIPTSLLAQVDSSVGGKTGINSRHGKNLIGLFNQPELVIADTDILRTLPEREFRAGYAEVAKYGLLGDANFFAWLEANRESVFSFGPALAEAIMRSCEAKARIVAEDEREHGRRALLNLGHTFGHALEAATGYSDRLIHGEGVAIGMAMAFRFSERLGLVGSNVVGRAVAHIHDAGLPTSVSEIPGAPLEVDALLRHIGQDKKVERGALTFILTRDIGEAFVERGVDPGQVRDFLSEELRAA
ncbi:MAG: 3-dehydroquinate synthase [Pseudomonadota bacterium]